jgi:phosphatidylglycerophosphate synthase
MKASGIESEPRDTPAWTPADLMTAIRFPLALAFVLVSGTAARIMILAVAAASDLADGWMARRYGASRAGAFLDPVADKVFMAAAFAVVLVEGPLIWLEIVAVLLRDLAATAAFLATVVFGRPAAIPARLGGKMVTVGQLLTLLAFLAESSYLRPMAWATGGIALYAVWDYTRVARVAHRTLGRSEPPTGES